MTASWAIRNAAVLTSERERLPFALLEGQVGRGPSLGDPVDEPAQRRGKAEVVEDGGAQVEGQGPHLLDRAVHVLDARVDSAVPLGSEPARAGTPG